MPHAHGVRWRACPDNDRTVCAYVDVPMDVGLPFEHFYLTALQTYRIRCGQYLDHSSNEKVSLFLRKLPADPTKVSEYMGPLLINPGGPGGSGNEDILGFGEGLYDLLDGAISSIPVLWAN